MGLLIVDDSVETCRSLQTILEAEGYTDIQLAYCTSDAMHILGLVPPATPAEPPDAILLDIRIPPVDGVETCRRIKACEAFRDVPVIIMTGWSETGQLQAAFAAGASDYLTKPIDPSELSARLKSAISVKLELTQRKAHLERLLELSQRAARELQSLRCLVCIDELTGVANRRQLNHTLRHEWARASREGWPLGLLMIDIDYFKAFNDLYGHPRGDQCLRDVADVLRRALRRPGDVLARYGGEEFAVILPNTPPAGALAVAEAIQERLAARRLPHAGAPDGRVTLSIGLAVHTPGDRDTAEQLIQAADRALYQAKRAGRNRIRLAEAPVAAADAAAEEGPAPASPRTDKDAPDLEEFAGRAGRLAGAWAELMHGIEDTTRRVEERIHALMQPPEPPREPAEELG